ncbi:MAG TPA: hypothetical protein DCZ95_19365 [Verrucomicrobia bacterium]|nr:MAG: hypothetical protein A2X46_13295 [Lentisphaerae bacterium GWF2_57_35]HBA86247.1 hypothetical protein [Verrucomicrobiota bacterium]
MPFGHQLSFVIACSFLIPQLASALTNRSAIAPCGGGWGSNTALQSFSSIGQGLLPGASENAEYIEFSGWANTFVMNASADRNQNGIPDENDPDDESDGIPDADELSGALFDPATATDPLLADSDFDDVSDQAEAAAGTNPRDQNSFFRLISLSRLLPNSRAIAWRAREGKTYELLTAATPRMLRNDPAVAGEYVGAFGIGLWKETLLVATNDTSVESERYWAVRLKQ